MCLGVFKSKGLFFFGEDFQGHGGATLGTMWAHLCCVFAAGWSIPPLYLVAIPL